MSGQPSEAQELVSNGTRATGRGSNWSRRDRCGNGHEFTAENTLWRVDSSPNARRCRQCLRAAGAKWYRERGAALRAARRQAAQ